MGTVRSTCHRWSPGRPLTRSWSAGRETGSSGGLGWARSPDRARGETGSSERSARARSGTAAGQETGGSERSGRRTGKCLGYFQEVFSRAAAVPAPGGLLVCGVL